MVERTDQGPMVHLRRGVARLDAGCVRFHHFPVSSRANQQVFRGALTGVTWVVYAHVLDAVRGGLCLRLDGGRVGRRAPLMISILWYSICNLMAGFSPASSFLLVFRTIARDRYGRGMAGRRGVGDEILAAAVSRADVGGAAGILGLGLRARGTGIWPALHAFRELGGGLWLARDADPRRAAGVRLRLDPPLRQRARGLAGESEEPGRANSAVKVPLLAIFGRDIAQHVDRRACG